MFHSTVVSQLVLRSTVGGSWRCTLYSGESTGVALCTGGESAGGALCTVLSQLLHSVQSTGVTLCTLASQLVLHSVHW